MRKFQEEERPNRVNEQIRIPFVLVIDQDGTKLGEMSNREALAKARDVGLDLVEVAPNVRPPVCRIMDFGKFKFEQGLKDKRQRQKSKSHQLKEVRLRPAIGEGDVDTKVKSIRNFLDSGKKVQLRLQFRARENAHREIGFDVINKIIEMVSDIGETLAKPRLEGKFITCIIEPIKNKG